MSGDASDPEGLLGLARAGDSRALGRLLEMYRNCIGLLARYQIGISRPIREPEMPWGASLTPRCVRIPRESIRTELIGGAIHLRSRASGGRLWHGCERVR